MSEKFPIPVCLFIFQRKDTVLKIIERVSQVKPGKIYLISDNGCNPEEKKRARECRLAAESAITWDCEIVRDYAEENRGVFENIGMGAMHVFEKEETAIFLEDDNLPEVSFFRFCKEMLEQYADNDRILWICGTNYLGKYDSLSGESYMFTQNLLPCGWASWGKKYRKYYDRYFENYSDTVIERMKYTYRISALYEQQMENINRERNRYLKGERFASWDYQMIFSIMSNDLLGISPNRNQIKNIGVDAFSEHGGSSFDNVMTRRFCGMPSYEMEFPLVHPKTVQIDPDYENKINKIILFPLYWRFRKKVKKFLGIFIPRFR